MAHLADAESDDSDSEVARLLGEMTLEEATGPYDVPTVTSLMIDWDEAARCPPVELPLTSLDG